MSSEVFEEPLELVVRALEAGPPSNSSYPYPSLRLTEAKLTRTFQSVILENPYLRAAVVPTLGGRILSLFDKRTGTELLGDHVLATGGSRGVQMVGGIELTLLGDRRLTAMAPVQFAAHENEEDEPAVLWLSEAVTGTGLSWHLKIELPPDRAELLLEGRIFNRTLDNVAYNAGLIFPAIVDSRKWESFTLTQSAGHGLALLLDEGPGHCELVDGTLRCTRFTHPRMIAPRQLDTWTTTIMPFSGLGAVSAIGPAGALAVEGSVIRLQAVEPLSGHKLVVLTASGQTLEAPVAARPEHIQNFDLPSEVAGVALLDSAKNIVLQWKGDWKAVPEGDPAALVRRRESVNLDSEAARFEIATRHAARVSQALGDLRANELEQADRRLEQALVHNGDDHLAWWLKAVAKRISGDESESAELLNAHYLAPLEPVLRAESFLSQPRSVEKAASPLLASMAEHPETFIEVAALLMEAGLFEQAGYWIDEALRHDDLPMLRYLLAYSHVEISGLEYEAAAQIEAAAQQPIGPPYPWRNLELLALRRLAERFPNEARIRALMALAEAAGW